VRNSRACRVTCDQAPAAPAAARPAGAITSRPSPGTSATPGAPVEQQDGNSGLRGTPGAPCARLTIRCGLGRRGMAVTAWPAYGLRCHDHAPHRGARSLACGSRGAGVAGGAGSAGVRARPAGRGARSGSGPECAGCSPTGTWLPGSSAEARISALMPARRSGDRTGGPHEADGATVQPSPGGLGRYPGCR
jgi:hypothetical protein